jgi:ring-1,2-phenylacetyl-CoA epoxidase subunit PaaD
MNSMNVTGSHTVQSIRELLSAINDPEVPAISIVELGIVRDVMITHESITVMITPTYSGCPAMKMIEDDIRNLLGKHGISNLNIQTVYSPAWTTDWIDENAKIKLRQYGIAPPHLVQQSPLLQIKIPVIDCPHCSSGDTELKSEFGSTACKSYYFCNSCRQAFEYFKAF